jgi:hypothetical protein
MYPLQALRDTGWLDYKIPVFLLAHNFLLAALDQIFLLAALLAWAVSPLLEAMLASLCSNLNRRILPRSLAAPLQFSVFLKLLALLEVMAELGCL